jgi:Mo-dependent nitrogenase C-terminus
MKHSISTQHSLQHSTERASIDKKGDDMPNSEFVISGVSIHSHKPSFDALKPIRQWLDNLQINDPQLARLICKLIPAQCPFERDLVVFGRKLAHIPPMCKLNPLYEQFAFLRFRSLCYLVDVCGETI